MSNPAALLQSSEIQLGSGAYLERADSRESELDHLLGAIACRFPRLSIGRAGRLARFAADVQRAEATMQRQELPGLVHALKRAGAAARGSGFADAVLVDWFAAVREAALRLLG